MYVYLYNNRGITKVQATSCVTIEALPGYKLQIVKQ